MASVRSIIRSIILFIFPRLPFVNVVTLLLLLAERAEREKVPPFGAKAVYAYVGLLFICAFGMSLNYVRRASAVVYSIQLVALSCLIYFTDAVNYRYPVKLRMATRMIGVAGYFFFYAFFSSRKPRPYWLRRTAEILLAIYACLTTYAVLQVSEDREGFLKLVPGSQTVLFLYATLLGCVGLCLLPGLFTYDITVMLTVLLTLSTVLVDSQISYWTKRRGLHYWNHIRLLADNIAILMGCIMYLTCTRKKLPEDDRPKSD